MDKPYRSIKSGIPYMFTKYFMWLAKRTYVFECVYLKISSMFDDVIWGFMGGGIVVDEHRNYYTANTALCSGEHSIYIKRKMSMFACVCIGVLTG